MDNKVDVVVLRLFFENTKHFGIVKLIDYLTSEDGREIEEIGITLDPLAIPSESVNIRADKWQSIVIGIRGKESPLESIEKVMKNFDLLPHEAIFKFDGVCDAWVDGVRSSVSYDDMSEEERKKFI